MPSSLCSTHAASSCEAALGFAGLPRPSYDRSLWALRTPGPASVTLSWDGSPGLRSPAHAVRREGLAGDVLHDWDGALADQRDRHRLGAHAVARDAAGGVHARLHRRRGGAFRDRGVRLRHRRHPSRQLEESLGQRRQVALHLLDRQDVGILGLHVAEVDGVTGLGAVEARLLNDGYAKVIAEGVEHGGANAPAGGRAHHDHAVAAEEDEIAQQIGAEEAARLLLEDDDVVGLRRDLVDDLVAVAPGVPDEGIFLRAGALPRPATGVPVVGPAHSGGVADGYPLAVADVDQLPDARHPVPGLGPARVAPALDRLQNRLPAVAAEVVVHVDDEQGRPLAEPRPGAVSGRG